MMEDLTGQRGLNRTGVRRPPCSLLQRKNSLNSQDVLVVNWPHFKSDLSKLTCRIADLPRHLLRTVHILEESRTCHVICCTQRAAWKILELRVSRGEMLPSSITSPWILSILSSISVTAWTGTVRPMPCTVSACPWLIPLLPLQPSQCLPR